MTNSTPTIYTASAHDIVHPSRLRRHIAILTLIAYIGQPIAATAEIIADQAASANNRPVVDTTANGLPLVQIAAPGAAGVSHNQYTQFNVDPAGLILNNSQSTVITQQAGYVSANPNLANSAARVILNEITSTHRSQLNGYTEVAGQQAEVVIANPNGITCNGCGFINTSRGVLTTGAPVMGASGSLDAFRVTGGDIQIGTAGLNGSPSTGSGQAKLDQLDLIARSIKVNGELWATNLNVITGPNLADYNTLGVQVIQGAGAKPTVGIDVALLGGMYANKITLIGTEAGVGVNSLGNFSAQAGEFTLDNQGQITLGGSTIASGNLTIAGNTNITNSGTLYSQQAAQLTSTGSITNSGLLSAQGNLTLNAANLNSTGILGAGIDINGNATQNGNLLITTQNQTATTGTNISGGIMNIAATDINLANSNTNARSSINLDATAGNPSTGGAIDLTGAQTQSVLGDIVLNAAGSVTNNQGSLYGVAITSTSASFSNTSGSVYASGNLNINSSTSLNNSGQLLAQGDLILNASSLNSTGTLGSGIDLNGNATQNGNLLITTQNQTATTGTNISGGIMNITATDINLTNSQTNAWSGINLNATAGNPSTGSGGTIDLTSAQTQSVIGSIVLNATGAVNNTAGQLFGAQVIGNSASFSNANGALGALGNISLTANSINNTNGQIGNALNGAGNITLTATGNLTNTGGQIGSDRDMNISANTIAGNGQVIAGRDTGISLQGNYTNAAGNVFKANRNLTFGTTGNFINQTALEAVGTLSVSAANITNQTGALINANLNMLTTAGDITNAGRIEGNTVETHSNNLNNTATVMGGTLNLYANNLNNLNASSFIGATQTVNLIIANALNNQDGATLYSLGDINIGSSLALNANGYLAGNAASVINQSATIEATGNLRISANTITNKRTVIGFQLSAPLPGTSVVVGNPRYTSTYQDDQLIATTTAQSMLLSGGSAWLQGNISNEYSTIASGMNLSQAGGSYNQLAQILNRYETRTGQQDNLVWAVTGTVSCGFFSSCYTYGWVNQPLPYSAVITTQIGSVNAIFSANNRISVTATTVNNQAVSNGAVGGTAATLGATLGSSQGSVTVSNNSNTLNVPASGLYTLRTQPNQTYLVVTDPRFTSYQNFISSDYMLNRLSLDPQQIQKRLGDGFYEQKLVTDQITAQTGRRYLGDYADSQSQFIALLDAGVKASQDLQLVSGIALTAKQIDSLTQDIIWMEEREVTLPNGSTERVLAPQVYLTRLTQTSLSPSGALIAANDIHMTSGDSITNSGTIQGRDSAILQAKNITNRGGIIGSQGFTLLKADNDIFNLSGKINGKTVGLNAGRDIVSERTSRNVTRTVNMGQQGDTGFGLFRKTPIMGVVNSTELGLESIISATDSLNVNAGRDISFIAASIASRGDATLNAGRDLTFGVLTNTESASTSLYSASRTNATQLTSGIQTGGNLNLLSGNNMRLTSVTLDIGKDATLISGGNLTLDASKNSTRSGFDTGVAQQRKYDETVIGTTLNAGGNINLIATRPGPIAPNGGEGWGEGVIKTGNINLQSANISSQKGKLAVLADNNVTIGATEEQHEFFQQMRMESKGRFYTTTTVTRDEIARTDAVGSNLSGNTISIQSGRDINITGSNISANTDITLAAMNDINLLAATETYQETHRREEVTNGLITGGSFGFTVGQDKQTTRTDIDGATQSQSRSRLGSTAGNIMLLSGGNTLIAGSDLTATQGALTATAGGGIGIFAGLDSLKQYTESHHDQDTGLFSKQRRTTTDTLIQSKYTGSTLAANNIELDAGADLVLQAAKLTGTGNTHLSAAGDLQLLSVSDILYSKHTETLQTDGVDLLNPGAAFADRRKISQTTRQTQTAQVTEIQSGGNLNSRSGGNTLIEAGKLNAGGNINLNAGYDANGNLLNPDAAITFAAVKDSDYLNTEDKHSSLSWQSQSGSGHNTETIRLANIKAGKGINVNATGGVIMDIPEVPKPVAEAAPQVDENGKPLPPATATIDNRTPQQRLTDHLNTLARTPGQEWIGQLANDPKVTVQWKQTQAAAEHWNYSQEGLTPEAAAVIAIAVTYGTAGVAGSAAGSMTGAAAGTTTVASAALAAGMSTLASQATVSLINNKGHVGKTLEELGRKESVKQVVTAMATAGALQSLNTALGIQGVNAKSAFTDQLQKNIINQSASVVINHAMYGGDLQQQLEQSLKNAFIDTGAAQGANLIGDLKGTTLNDFTHKLAHAIVGCAAGAAKSNDCSSGALGAVVGEIAAEFYGGNRTGDSGPDLSTFKTDTVSFSRLMSGIAALLTGNDVNLAAAAGGNAAENNYLDHKENEDRLEAARGCANGDAEACNIKDTLDALDKARDEVLNLACQGNTKSDACKTATKDMRGKLDTYFQTQNGVQLKDNVLSTEEQNAGLGNYTAKTELQSYVNLLAVSNQQRGETRTNGILTKTPDKYDSDPYRVMNPEKSDLYMVIKVGDQWGVVGKSDGVYTSMAGVNGQSNSTNYAPGLMGIHVERESADSSLYTLYYNPTEGGLMDTWESTQDKAGFTTPVTKNFSQILGDVQKGDHTVSWVAHSQGGAIFSEAVRFNGGDLSKNSVAFHAGANNQLMTNYHLKNAGINSGKETTYLNSPWDLVPNIVGLNTLNPIKITGSLLVIPNVIFGDPLSSPHTLPPAKPNKHVQGVTP